MFRPGFLVCAGTALVALSPFLFGTVSCTKNNTATPDTTIAAPLPDSVAFADDYTVAQMIVNDAIRQADRSMDISSGSSMSYRTTTSCAADVVHTWDSTYINFGAASCEGVDNRTRKGKILIVHPDNRYSDSNRTHTVYLQDYFVNEHRASGAITVKNKGRNSFGQPSYSLTVNVTVTRSFGATLTLGSNITRLWKGGFATATNRNDDVFEEYGSGNYTRTLKGIASVYTVSISQYSPLTIAFNCNWVESGKVVVGTSGSSKTKTINYGDATTCDRNAMLEMANNAKLSITLQ